MFGDRNGVASEQASARNVLARPVPTDDPQTISALGRELNLADSQAGHVHELIERLERRLQPILCPSPPNNAGAGGVSPVAPTDVSRMAQDINSKTASAIDRLRSLLDRLDL